jgi:micrococcal nuclease
MLLGLRIAILALLMGIVPPAQAADIAGDVPSGVIDPERIIVIDGDSIQVDGREWRLEGFDTPEFDDAKCEAEHRAGLFAKRRLMELIAAAQRVEVRFSSRFDRHKRVLGSLLLDGHDVRDTMIKQGYARPYSGGWIKDWCTRSTKHDLLPEETPR